MTIVNVRSNLLWHHREILCTCWRNFPACSRLGEYQQVTLTNIEETRFTENAAKKYISLCSNRFGQCRENTENIFLGVSSGLSGREQEKTSAVFEPKLLSREFDRVTDGVTDRNNKLCVKRMYHIRKFSKESHQRCFSRIDYCVFYLR